LFIFVIKMPGQLSNFIKSIKNIIPYVETISSALPIGVGYDIFKNLSVFDDPKADAKDKTVAVAKAIAAPLGLIPGPVGMVADKAANAFIDTANYLTDLSTGKADPPPKNNNGIPNPVADMPSTIVNSTPFKQFINNFGNNWGGGGGWFF
jgi:hypothetical protein